MSAGRPNRSASFGQGTQDHEEDPPFDLPPEKEAYYTAAAEGDRHREKMAGMSDAERKEYMRGLRETLNDSTPKRGDFDNPLKKDTPREPAPPRVRRQADPLRAARVQRKHITALARKSRGRRR